MNQKSIEKIQAATPFIIWFRYALSPTVQAMVRPHLDQPYKLALKVLDCCSDQAPRSVDEIARVAKVSRETARQVLKALQAGGVPFAISPTHQWQPIDLGQREGSDHELLNELLPSRPALPLQR
jgi:hypothetical protein